MKNAENPRDGFLRLIYIFLNDKIAIINDAEGIDVIRNLSAVIRH